MISIDDHSPSDPSSSQHNHHQQQEKFHDLKVSDIDLKSTVAHLDDTNNPLPNFSIRDYVFTLRNKDIACNWPFTSTSLQLCLKHGVKNLLPPFQSLDSLRNNPTLGRCSPKICLTNEELVSCFDGKPTNDRFRSNKELVSASSKGSKQYKESQIHLQRQLGQIKSKEKPPTASQKPENAYVNTTMTSKVCPVCKIFSSSSNTTLNAHIDQCLTGEGTMKWADSPKVMVKHKVKPRKISLMVDIYKTAPHCTVEEFDRRNGTSWATNSSFPAQECQIQEEEEEKEEPTLTKVNPVVAENEGDVYIDTNGTKFRVLSIPKTGSSDNHGDRKTLIMRKKKNSLKKKKHQKKYQKLSTNAGKLCLPKPRTIDEQAITGRRENVVAENCSKDERSKENTHIVGLGIIRTPWACSKRTGVSKKLDEEHWKAELKSHRMKDSVVENRDSSFAGCNLASSRSRKKTRTSSLLSMQPVNETAACRKNVDCDDDDDDDDDDDGIDDSSQSQHSNDDDIDTRSKDSKLSALRKNLSYPAVKFCFKRKFQLSNSVSKEQCRTQEYKSTNKRQDTRSMTSKSTSNEESLVEIQTANGNELESLRNETSSSIPAKSFMGLSTSFDPEFATHECFELYQDQTCSTNHAPNNVDKHENYFQKIDPIPIPGPPGSFLPASPGGETVSEAQIQDSVSHSPVSTISNSRSSFGKEDTYKKQFFNGDAGFTESGQSHKSFKNDKPCCCSRKEAALNYQDLYILRKQTVESNTSTQSGLNYESEMFSVSNYPNSSATNSNVGPLKPVLRLMGKNLTIVGDEFRPPQSSQQSQRSVNFSEYQSGFDSQHFSVQPPRGDSQPINRFSKGSYEQMNPLYTMYPPNAVVGGGGGGSLVFRGGSFQTSSANRAGGGKWNVESSTAYYPPTYP